MNERIDWERMHEQLRTAELSLYERATADDAGALLAERARALAKPLEEEADVGAELELLTFALAGEQYAIEARHVIEVVALEAAVRVPHTPHFMLGVVNHRGEALPVIDLALLVGASGGGERRELVAVRVGEQRFGLAVDEAEEVTRCPAAHLSPVRIGDRTGFVRPVRGRLMAVVDVDVLAAGGQLEVNEELRMDQVDQGRESS